MKNRAARCVNCCNKHFSSRSVLRHLARGVSGRAARCAISRGAFRVAQHAALGSRSTLRYLKAATQAL